MRSAIKYVAAVVTFSVSIAFSFEVTGQTKPRARDLGVPFGGTPGTNNAITDVGGVMVGQVTVEA